MVLKLILLQCLLLRILLSLDGDWKLVVVTQASYVGQVPHGGDVYCVDKIGIIPLVSYSGMATEIIGLEVCRGRCR